MDKLLQAQFTETERPAQLNDRYEDLLKKWEEQAKRMDAVLDAEERKAGIKRQD